ncbi:MAG: aminotransferase class IV [Verrucomicrobiota bacterium]
MASPNPNPELRFDPWRGVFETIRVDEGMAQFVDEHWLSLGIAAQALGLKITHDFREDVAALPRVSGRWRWIVDRDGCRTTFNEEVLPDWSQPPRGWSLSVAEQTVGSANWDARYKTLSYLTHQQAREAADTDEALLLNQREHVATGSMTNLCWRRGRELFTPDPKAGARDGVILRWALREAPDLGLITVAGHFDVDELKRADEIFVTNSLIGIQPITSFEERNVPAGEVALQLRRRLAEEVMTPAG